MCSRIDFPLPHLNKRHLMEPGVGQGEASRSSQQRCLPARRSSAGSSKLMALEDGSDGITSRRSAATASLFLSKLA